MPADVQRHEATIWNSNGIALDTDVYRPTTIATEARLPAVVLCHGWGGSKLTAERYAALFASAGMITLSFTQSSWFGSGSPLELVGAGPAAHDAGEAVARVRNIRDLVDPFSWASNIRSAMDYIEGEPNVDPARIGLWATSFGGGIAVYAAAHDPRVKALALQVPAIAPLAGPIAEYARRRAIDMARGDAPPIPQGVDSWPNLAGTPHMGSLAHFDPLVQVERLRIPTLIRDAGDEEMFPIPENGGRAAEILHSLSAEVDYEVIPGITHYGIYFEGYEKGSKDALAWLERHL
jgi:dienelactone hydrolase